MSDTLIDLIRHGEPQGGSRYRGHGCDDPLSDKGWAQMWRAVGDARPWDRLLSSPMARCVAFARTLGERHGLDVRVDERLREVGFGRWEGLTRQQVEERDPQGYAAFYRDPVAQRPDGAEDLNAFSRRVAAALDHALETHAGEHLLLVCHAGVIRALLGHVLQAPAERWYRIRVDNAGLSRLRFGRHGGMLEFHNRGGLGE